MKSKVKFRAVQALVCDSCLTYCFKRLGFTSKSIFINGQNFIKEVTLNRLSSVTELDQDDILVLIT